MILLCKDVSWGEFQNIFYFGIFFNVFFMVLFLQFSPIFSLSSPFSQIFSRFPPRFFSQIFFPPIFFPEFFFPPDFFLFLNIFISKYFNFRINLLQNAGTYHNCIVLGYTYPNYSFISKWWTPILQVYLNSYLTLNTSTLIVALNSITTQWFIHILNKIGSQWGVVKN